MLHHRQTLSSASFLLSDAARIGLDERVLLRFLALGRMPTEAAHALGVLPEEIAAALGRLQERWL